MPARNISPAGLGLIAEFEGFVGHGYNDAAGHCTIGYGHLLHHGGCSTAELRRTITRAGGLGLLRRDAHRFDEAVDRLVKVPLSQNEHDALVSFAFNVGEGNLATSTLLRRLNEGNRRAAAAEFGRWTRAGGRVLAGLVRRRQAEEELFLTRDRPRWDGFTANERAWIDEYDRLLKSRSRPRRRKALRALMAAQRKRIWHAAQPKGRGGDGRGWVFANRSARYAALLARSN